VCVFTQARVVVLSVWAWLQPHLSSLSHSLSLTILLSLARSTISLSRSFYYLHLSLFLLSPSLSNDGVPPEAAACLQRKAELPLSVHVIAQGHHPTVPFSPPLLITTPPCRGHHNNTVSCSNPVKASCFASTHSHLPPPKHGAVDQHLPMCPGCSERGNPASGLSQKPRTPSSPSLSYEDYLAVVLTTSVNKPCGVVQISAAHMAQICPCILPLADDGVLTNAE
jgi:hypothetical protein